MSGMDPEIAARIAAPTPKQVLQRMHERCAVALTRSTDEGRESSVGESLLFASDLESWAGVLRGRPECGLLDTAIEEYAIAILNASHGQYRNAFKGLRLVLELSLQASYLSSDLIELHEWISGKADTVWARLIHESNGPLGGRFCGAFFPDLEGDVAHFRGIATALYRELSECIHGNPPTRIPLPEPLSFDNDAFVLWHQKAKLVRLVTEFAFALRYLCSLSAAQMRVVEPGMLDQLSHLEPIRKALGGPGAA